MLHVCAACVGGTIRCVCVWGAAASRPISSGSGIVMPCTIAPGWRRAALSARSSQSGGGRQSSSVNATTGARAARHPAFRLGPSGARNAGWRAARAPLIAFTDDDCVPSPGWLAALVAAAGPDTVVQGPVQPIPSERRRLGPFSRSLWVDRLGPWYQAANVLYPRELLERLGGFDSETFPFAGEDCDLAWRALEDGAEAVWAPDARVHHAVNELGPAGSLRVALRWSESILL